MMQVESPAETLDVAGDGLPLERLPPERLQSLRPSGSANNLEPVSNKLMKRPISQTGRVPADPLNHVFGALSSLRECHSHTEENEIPA